VQESGHSPVEDTVQVSASRVAGRAMKTSVKIACFQAGLCLPLQLQLITIYVCVVVSILGGVALIVLIIGPKVGRFKPGRGQWIFNGYKSP
jgi:hypothetical protein